MVAAAIATVMVAASIALVAPSAVAQETCGGETVTVDIGSGDTATDGDDVIMGTDGDDVIAGAGGDDLICGGGGNDTVWGQAGNDMIWGGDGDDKLRGGDGDDSVWGGAGVDDVNGGRDADMVYGDEGDDAKVRGGTGDDMVWGGAGADLIVAGNGGMDSVWGGDGDDELVSGGPRVDSVYGGTGADLIKGGSGADMLDGGVGNDDLRGNNGPDAMDGGLGIDICNGGPDTDTAVNCESELNLVEPFTMTIVHMNDHHSHLDSDSADLDLAGVSTRVTSGGFPRAIAKANEISAARAGENVVKIHAGDAITGTLFYTLFDGEADAALMNELCFDVFALGNHEFDSSDAGLATFLDFLAEGDCGTQTVAANVIPAIGTPLAPVAVDDYIKPYVIKSYGGEQVGFVGIDIKTKTELSSSPLDTTVFLDEVETAQATIDELTAAGVNKIVLVTHIQLANDLDLASMVSGVDVIVGGDSHSLLGDFGDVGVAGSGPYPIVTTDADGGMVCIVQAFQYAQILGELTVEFDVDGNVDDCDGTPHMMIGDDFLRRPPEGGDRAPVTGDDLQAILDFIDITPEVSIVAEDADARALLDSFSAEVEVLEQQVVGTVAEDLCLERIPGQGRSLLCDVSATAVNGGDIQQLVAEAFRVRSFEADMAIQNAGGVREDVPAGDYTVADAYDLLPFANTIVNLNMSAAEIIAVLEEAIEFAVFTEGGSTGAYPYAAGLRWDADMTQPFGSRLSNFEMKPSGTDTWVPFDMSRMYNVATNNFIGEGGDRYATFAAVTADGRSVDTFLDYAKSFLDYVEQDAGGVLSKLPVSEYSTQSFIPRPAE